MASFWDQLTGSAASDASNAAAQDTYAKQKAATGALTDYGDQYAGQFKNLAQGYQPYVQAGNSALQRLLGGLGLPGGDGADFTAAYRATPGYQSALDTGTKAAITGANAGNMLNSGRTLKALQQYGQNYEDQQSGNYLNRLGALQGEGLQATGQQNATVGQGLQGQLQTRQSAYGGDMTAANTIGLGQVAGANAEAAGTQNLLNTGLKIGGMALGATGFGGPLGQGGAWGSPIQTLMQGQSSYPVNGTKPFNTYGLNY